MNKASRLALASLPAACDDGGVDVEGQVEGQQVTFTVLGVPAARPGIGLADRSDAPTASETLDR
ncbi:hypothetical protein WMF26_20835 [Sorangium sp. So ce185]|uniref:hypothetical protein n=1 Tax=Sorangium sp. So ce185 TaxID=3133287 RepID=UPI003F63967A